jgi:hypothetical protein
LAWRRGQRRFSVSAPSCAGAPMSNGFTRRCCRPNQRALKNKGTLEAAQHIVNHENPRTTRLYDRRQEEISLDGVEQILIDMKC